MGRCGKLQNKIDYFLQGENIDIIYYDLYRTRRPNIIGQFHDESINLVKEGEQSEHSDALNWAIKKLNQELKLNVDLGIDIQYGQRYSDVHL